MQSHGEEFGLVQFLAPAWLQARILFLIVFDCSGVVNWQATYAPPPELDDHLAYLSLSLRRWSVQPPAESTRRDPKASVLLSDRVHIIPRQASSPTSRSAPGCVSESTSPVSNSTLVEASVLPCTQHGLCHTISTHI